jgi:hypothetical protein
MYDTFDKDTGKNESEQLVCSLDCCGNQRRGWEEDQYSYSRRNQNGRICKKVESRSTPMGRK